MTVPIVDDWKAINARMQEIKAEQYGATRTCPKCDNVGWVFNYHADRSAYRICDRCHNPERLPRPVR